MTAAASGGPGGGAPERVVGDVVLLFVVFVPFAFSEELVGGASDACWAAGCDVDASRWHLPVVDAVLMIAILAAAWIRGTGSSTAC